LATARVNASVTPNPNVFFILVTPIVIGPATRTSTG
jgi:hypothetical protein